jgi:hypothetical protein
MAYCLNCLFWYLAWFICTTLKHGKFSENRQKLYEFQNINLFNNFGEGLNGSNKYPYYGDGPLKWLEEFTNVPLEEYVAHETGGCQSD